MNTTESMVRRREAELQAWQDETRDREPVGDLVTLLPILRPDPLVEQLRDLDDPGAEPSGALARWWARFVHS